MSTDPKTAHPEEETLDFYKKTPFSARKEGIDQIPEGFELDALIEFTRRLKPGDRILDAGFGSGSHIAYFLKKGFYCDGFEGSDEVLTATQARLETLFPEDTARIKLWKADFRTLTLRRDSCDAVWANNVFNHLPPQGVQRVMQIFFKAIKPGGVIFASFDKAETDAKNFTHHEEQKGELRRHFYRYPENEFQSLVRQSGFQPLALGHDTKNPIRMGVLAKRV